MSTRGFFGIGLYHPKHECNQGTLWRSAYAFGANFAFTVGQRFQKQASDVPKAHLHVPTYKYEDMDDLIKHLPYGCMLVGVELASNAHPLDRFCHPERAVYLLGAEDHGLPPKIIERCHALIQLPDLNTCLNVATMGSLVMYDRRIQKVGTKTLRRTASDQV